MLRDFLQDSWTFQETLEEGREQGLEQGFIQGQRQSIVIVAEVRFPGLLSMLKSQIASLTDQTKLQKILSMVSTASSEDEFRQFMAALS